MNKPKKSLFEIIIIPALASFVMGLVPILLLVISNWVTAKKEGDTKKGADLAVTPASSTAKSGSSKTPKPDFLPTPTEKPPPVQTADVTRSTPPGFQPRSAPKDVIPVGHGKVEVTAEAVAERKVIITLTGREFANDFSPLPEWLGKTGNLFERKIKQLGLGTGTWKLVSPGRTFVIQDGIASLELTWEQD